MLDLQAKITRVNEALMPGTSTIVSSFTQAYMIVYSHPEYCIGNLAEVVDPNDEYYLASQLAMAVAFYQLVVGRMQLVELSLSAFLEQQKQLPETAWLNYEISRLEGVVNPMRRCREEYQDVADKLMKRWTRKWEQVLGNDLKRHFEKIEYEFEMFKCYNEPRAFQSPSGLFEFATNFRKCAIRIFGVGGKV
ncbi:hypothetical protein SeLEV6574_g07092 [Synchytrium endobioticum]|uniref:Uncharacterized protein n=1 Tax=Synchytrium endobioticum TaxID=286115 RepID=A0A507CLT1_9FUNG|nr:hypothetical protein SeLEV6574_g07092 [Synchytrium endobioticum]